MLLVTSIIAAALTIFFIKLSFAVIGLRRKNNHFYQGLFKSFEGITVLSQGNLTLQALLAFLAISVFALAVLSKGSVSLKATYSKHIKFRLFFLPIFFYNLFYKKMLKLSETPLKYDKY